jgi:hypothetical protein
MLDQIQLIKTWEIFKSELQQYVTKAGELILYPAKNADELREFQEQVNAWDNEVVNWLSVSFNISNNSFVNEFHNEGGNFFSIPGHIPNVVQEIARAKEKVQNKQLYLVYNERILSVCDTIVRRDEIDLDERAKMKMKQKQEFIIKKLYDLYDDNYYPLEAIFKGNGVKLNRNGEVEELAGVLEEQGYLDLQRAIGSDTIGRLTAVGAGWVEESMEPVSEDYNDILFTDAELAQKLDDIKVELIKSGLGHEILYDELQEMKELYKTLNKKTWGQLLKGKLFDVAISKAVDTATLTFVYKELTDHGLKLF